MPVSLVLLYVINHFSLNFIANKVAEQLKYTSRNMPDSDKIELLDTIDFGDSLANKLLVSLIKNQKRKSSNRLN